MDIHKKHNTTINNMNDLHQTQVYLFKKHQKELLAFANTNFGKQYMAQTGARKELYDGTPIVHIYPSGFIQFLGFEKDKPRLRLTTHPGTIKYGECMVELFGAILTKLELAQEYRIRDQRLLPFVIPHFMGESQKLSNQLPQIFLDSSTFNPQAGTGGGNVTVDGRVEGDSTNDTWANKRINAGGYSDNTTRLCTYFDSTATSGNWLTLTRGIFTLDTSALGAGATGVTGIFSVYGFSKQDTGTAVTPNTNIYASTPASNNALVNGDFAQTGTTAYAPAITYVNFSTTAYNDYDFNATGDAAISLTGITKLSIKNGQYDADNSAPTWSNPSAHGYEIDFADNTNKPKLVVTYTPEPVGGIPFMWA